MSDPNRDAHFIVHAATTSNGTEVVCNCGALLRGYGLIPPTFGALLAEHITGNRAVS